MLAAHAGELARNDVDRLLRARAEASASLAAERVFGSGVAADRDLAYAELICEAVPRDGGWLLGSPRRLDPAAPLAPPSARAIGWWIEAESIHDRLRRT